MTKRLFSTIALWSIVIGTVYFFHATGGLILLAVFTLLAQFEFHHILAKSGLPPWSLVTLVFGFIFMLGAGGIFSPDFNDCLLGIFFLVGPIALVVAALSLVKNPDNVNRLGGSILALAYVPGLMVYYVKICHLSGSVAPAIWVIATAKFTDVGGYLVGSAIGKNKLAPAISPGKTWEGVAGGLALAALIAALGAHFMPTSFPLTPLKAAVFALPIGIAAIVSDLAESAFKRRAGMKDSGACIPGIGGALDLADSLLLAAPVAYFLLR